jgi:hypothetical protein
VFIKLPRKVRSLLKHHPGIRALAKATATDLAGNVGHGSGRLTIKAAKKKTKRH